MLHWLRIHPSLKNTRVFVLVLLACVAACKTPFFQPSIALSKLTFNAAADANDTSPIAVELVLVRDEELAKILLVQTASQWFDPRANWKRDYPQALQTWYYEITPGQRMTFDPTPFSRQSGQALLLYANYKGNGAYRLRLDSYPKATVLFLRNEMKLSDLTAN